MTCLLLKTDRVKEHLLVGDSSLSFYPKLKHTRSEADLRHVRSENDLRLFAMAQSGKDSRSVARSGSTSPDKMDSSHVHAAPLSASNNPAVPLRALQRAESYRRSSETRSRGASPERTDYYESSLKSSKSHTNLRLPEPSIPSPTDSNGTDASKDSLRDSRRMRRRSVSAKSASSQDRSSSPEQATSHHDAFIPSHKRSSSTQRSLSRSPSSLLSISSSSTSAMQSQSQGSTALQTTDQQVWIGEWSSF